MLKVLIVGLFTSWHCRRPNELPQPGDNRLLPCRSMRDSWQALGVLRKELQREKLPPLSGYSRRSAERPQSSSAPRFTAGAIGFLTTGKSPFARDCVVGWEDSNFQPNDYQPPAH
jgi:hypothetical protein